LTAGGLSPGFDGGIVSAGGTASTGGVGMISGGGWANGETSPTGGSRQISGAYNGLSGSPVSAGVANGEDDCEGNGEAAGGEVLGAGVCAYAQTAPARTPKSTANSDRLDTASLGAQPPPKS
jgi:hypothetical protein